MPINALLLLTPLHSVRVISAASDIDCKSKAKQLGMGRCWAPVTIMVVQKNCNYGMGMVGGTCFVVAVCRTIQLSFGSLFVTHTYQGCWHTNQGLHQGDMRWGFIWEVIESHHGKLGFNWQIGSVCVYVVALSISKVLTILQCNKTGFRI